jgi:RHS repeat-associated protein
MIAAKSGSSTTTYTYDFDNRLTEVEQNGTVIATYVYDALGRRIGVDDNGTQTWTVYDGTNPYADFNGAGSLEVRYQFAPGVVDGAIVDQLLARTSSGGTTAWYLPDKLGSVRDIVSAAGTELDHIVYDSFGNIVTETDAANGDRFKYAGMEFDSTTGQDYDRARDYDSTLGRFAALDPLGFAAGDTNLFRYAGDDVTGETDPTGTQVGQPQPPAGTQTGSQSRPTPVFGGQRTNAGSPSQPITQHGQPDITASGNSKGDISAEIKVPNTGAGSGVQTQKSPNTNQKTPPLPPGYGGVGRAPTANPAPSQSSLPAPRGGVARQPVGTNSGPSKCYGAGAKYFPQIFGKSKTRTPAVKVPLGSPTNSGMGTPGMGMGGMGGMM